MSVRSPRGLFILFAAIQALGEFISATYIEVWMFALAFGVLLLLSAELVRRGRIVAGSVIAVALSLFELANYPLWRKANAWDWIFDSVLAAAAAVTVVAAVWLLGTRRHAAVVG